MPLTLARGADRSSPTAGSGSWTATTMMCWHDLMPFANSRASTSQAGCWSKP